jgi:predicted esterase
MKNLLLILCCFASLACAAQTRINGNFPFQSDPAKKYSIYVPAAYNAATPHRLMLGLHPLNTSRWDGESWCDTLINFAKTNNLLLVCPDGGTDGAIDDPIDTAFTSALLDSMQIWYNIDTKKVYVMGFSWGGKTTYSYGLSHAWRFAGFMPIGAATSGTNDVNGIIQHAAGKPFFLVHGSGDSPNNRFYPVRSALIANNAIEKDTLMPGIGHTIDFPNRNLILSMAYQWIDSVNCAQLTSVVPELEFESKLDVFPNPTNNVLNIQLDSQGNFDVEIVDAFGKIMIQAKNRNRVDVSGLSNGVYFLQVKQGDKTYLKKFIRE